jgi:hypothetical protein
MRWGNVAQAATACGLPTESWRTWERDGVSPRNINDIAWTIAERTGCNYAWLADGSRLTTYVATRAGKGPAINSRYSTPTEKTRPPGHPKDATPHWSTRRPGRLIPDLARA